MTDGEFAALVADIRTTYVERELVPAIKQLSSRTSAPSSSEVKFSNIDGVYKGIAAVDWLENGPTLHATVVASQALKEFEPFEHRRGARRIVVSPFAWDAVHVAGENGSIDPVLFERWFDKWFDLADDRPQGPGLGEIIHSAILSDGGISLDMGSATVEALSELLDALEASGLQRVHIGKVD